MGLAQVSAPLRRRYDEPAKQRTIGVDAPWPVMFERFRKPGAEELLAPLAGVIDGTLSDGRLHGRYHGYAIEAWPERRDPRPSLHGLEEGSASPADMFSLRVSGVEGERYWYCERIARLFRSRRLDFEITGRLGGGKGRPLLGKLAGVEGPDAALVERLSRAGLIDAAMGLGGGPQVSLPRVSYQPSPKAAVEKRLRGAGLESVLRETLRAAGASGLPAGAQERIRAAEERLQGAGELLIEIEVGPSRVPTDARFRELLDLALRMVQINISANAPPGGGQP